MWLIMDEELLKGIIAGTLGGLLLLGTAWVLGYILGNMPGY